uniref:J domain-containing protein n=1 Tax=Meloidogyne javanica TaxID=6303 RepID=A0A915LXV5_MELJA
YHPDVSGSSDASNKKFVEISNAYETLKDEQKRREYDRQLRFGTSQERPSTGRETRQPPTWSTDFHPRPPFRNQEWEKEWKWQFGAESDRQRRRPFSPFDDIFGGPPPSVKLRLCLRVVGGLYVVELPVEVEPVPADVDGPVEVVDAGVAVGAPVGPVPVEVEPVSADVDGPVEA